MGQYLLVLAFVFAFYIALAAMTTYLRGLGIVIGIAVAGNVVAALIFKSLDPVMLAGSIGSGALWFSVVYGLKLLIYGKDNTGTFDLKAFWKRIT